MRVLQLEAIGAPLVERSLSIPIPRADEVLVRVRAAGICHTDVNLRHGRSGSPRLPLIPGHEIAGEIAALGGEVSEWSMGARVGVHYVVSCGTCVHCSAGREQFCALGAMMGAHRSGGYAEYVVVPLRNLVRIPESIAFEHAAVMMCSSATALHALRRGRHRVDESVAVFGVGGLGISAVQLAHALGASRVFAVDLDSAKLDVAARLGAIPIHASLGDAVAQIRAATHNSGVDVALDLVGTPEVTMQALQCLAIHGRAVAVGIHPAVLALPVYRSILGPETELIGANDHLFSELTELLAFCANGRLDLSPVVVRTVPLDADAVNGVLDELDAYRAPFRTVIVP